MQAVSARDRKIASACDSRGVSVQLLWCNFDCQASISFWWSAGQWDRRCYSRTKDDIYHVRTIIVPLTCFFLIFPISLRSAALVGVLASTGSCEFGFLHPSLQPYRCRSYRHAPTCDWKAGKCTPRQRILLFAMRLDLSDRVCPTPRLVSLVK